MKKKKIDLTFVYHFFFSLYLDISVIKTDDDYFTFIHIIIVCVSCESLYSKFFTSHNIDKISLLDFSSAIQSNTFYTPEFRHVHKPLTQLSTSYIFDNLTIEL